MKEVKILELHPDGVTTWTMPWPIYQMVQSGLTNPLLRTVSKAGRWRTPSVEYVVNLLPQGFREHIKREDRTKKTS